MTKEIMLVFEFRKLFKYAINGGGKIITPGPMLEESQDQCLEHISYSLFQYLAVCLIIQPFGE